MTHCRCRRFHPFWPRSPLFWGEDLSRMQDPHVNRRHSHLFSRIWRRFTMGPYSRFVHSSLVRVKILVDTCLTLLCPLSSPSRGRKGMGRAERGGGWGASAHLLLSLVAWPLATHSLQDEGERGGGRWGVWGWFRGHTNRLRTWLFYSRASDPFATCLSSSVDGNIMIYSWYICFNSTTWFSVSCLYFDRLLCITRWPPKDARTSCWPE